MWRKASFCDGGNCVEVRKWRKARKCENGGCVEVAGCGHTVQVRDSKNPDGPVLTFTPAAWAVFLADVKRA